MTSLLSGLLIVYLCSLNGRSLLKIIGASSGEGEKWIWGTSLGFGMLAYGVLGLGSAGFLSPWGLGILLLFFMLTGFPIACSDLKAFKARAVSFRFPVLKFFDILLLVAVTVSLFSAMAGMLAPETANDSLCYHLHLPKIYLSQKRISHLPYEFNATFPLLMEMLYTAGLGLGGITLAKFFHFATGLLAAAGIFTFSKRFTGRRVSACAALIFLTTPGILNQISTTYVDVGLTLFVFLALWTCLEGIEKRRNSFFILAGIFLGFAMSIKYLAAVPALFLGILTISQVLQSRNHFSWKAPVLLSFFAFLFCFYWYFNAYAKTGNPVFPYFYFLFKAGNPSIHYNDIGVPKTVLSFLLLPWTITMRPELFEGFGVQIGPAYLALLPAGIMAGWPCRPIRQMLGFVLVFLIAWFFLGQSLRFFFPALPVLAILAALGLGELAPLVKGRMAAAFAVVILFLHAGFAFYHYRDDFRVALGFEQPADYLARKERSFGMAQYVNQHLPADVKILAADETHLFYFNRPIVRETVYADRGRYFQNTASFEEAMRHISDDKFTHILFVDSKLTARRPPGDRSKLSFRITDLPNNKLADFLESIYTDTFTDTKGERTVYRLYRIRLQHKNL